MQVVLRQFQLTSFLKNKHICSNEQAAHHAARTAHHAGEGHNHDGEAKHSALQGSNQARSNCCEDTGQGTSEPHQRQTCLPSPSTNPLKICCSTAAYLCSAPTQSADGSAIICCCWVLCSSSPPGGTASARCRARGSAPLHQRRPRSCWLLANGCCWTSGVHAGLRQRVCCVMQPFIVVDMICQQQPLHGCCHSPGRAPVFQTSRLSLMPHAMTDPQAARSA